MLLLHSVGIRPVLVHGGGPQIDEQMERQGKVPEFRGGPKVFKGWVIDLAPGEQRTLAKQHSLKQVTTRRYHAGAHALDVRINGQVMAHAGFTLAL